MRVQLADCIHAIGSLGWVDIMLNQVSVRAPGKTVCYLTTPFGLTYDEVTPKNVLKVDSHGNPAEPSDFEPNPAGFALHGAIYDARPDATCVMHTHTNAVSAISLKQNGLGHDDFFGAQLFGRVTYQAFDGSTLRAAETAGTQQTLGKADVLILRNHGVAVCGADIPRAFMLLLTVQRAAEIQCQAGMLPGPNTALTDQQRQHRADNALRLVAADAFATKLFDATVRKCARRSGE